MNRSYVQDLFAAKHVTARQRDILLSLVDSGVTDPCVAGATPAVAKLWYTHLPPCSKRGISIVEVRDLLMRKNFSFLRRQLVTQLSHRFARCAPLETFLQEWLAVTKDEDVLEALTWQWVAAAGSLPEDANEDRGAAVNVAEAAIDPVQLVHLLSNFKHSANRRVDPCAIVDRIAISNRWWSEDSSSRADAFVSAAIDDGLKEHEWMPLSDIVVERLGAHVTTDTVRRMISDRKLVFLASVEGVTTPGILATSRAVKNALLSLQQVDAPPWSCARPDDLTGEQIGLFDRIVSGKRITLCCSPAGTGKTFTAACVAAQTPGGGCQVLCMAPTWKAVSVLRQKVVMDNTIFMTVQGFALLDEKPNVKLVLVDESSMLTMPQMKCVLCAYQACQDVRILFMGDDVQVPCIGRGFPIRDLDLALTDTVRLTQCLRTEGRGLVALANAVRIGAAIDPVEDEVAVLPAQDALEATRHILSTTMTAVHAPWEPEFVQIISPQNKDVELINDMVQKMFTFSDAVQPFSKCFVGDAVRIVENTEHYKNGDEGILVDLVEGTHRGTNGSRKRKCQDETRKGVVRLVHGNEVEVSDRHIAPAYATTVHKVQGSEYPTVIFAVFRATHPNLRTREMIYTSVTRAKAKLFIVGHTPCLSEATPLVRRTVFAHLDEATQIPEW